MGGERRAPKGSRHGGGFLQLFDWNTKSRKKLFPSKSDFSEHPKQGKKSKENFPMTRIQMLDEDEIGAITSMKGSSVYSYASSVTDDEGYGSKAPGVVARLMGLDSLPTTNVIVPIFDTQSLNETLFQRKDLHFYHEHHHILHSGTFFDEAESLPKHPRSLSRAVQKFQLEILPPKSARSIPITQHKLLSPIKNPRFVPSNDLADIVEAAAKIIDSGPQASHRTKIYSAGSSSVPLQVRELKEKMAASQRALDSNAARSFKGQPLNEGKSINLAIQAKVNVQRREGLNPKRRQEDEASGPTQSSKNESSSQKIEHKKPSVLRQNNQKQNCNSAKSLGASNVHGRKAVSGDSSHGRQRNLYKDGSKKSSLEARDGHKDFSHSGSRNVPRKKRIIDGNQQDWRNDNNEKISQSNSKTDVVSFTFTTPMTRSMELPEQLFADNRSETFMPCQEMELSVLLEQKLRELTNGFEASKCNFSKAEASSTSARQDSINFFAASKTGPEVPRRRYDLQLIHRHPSPDSILGSSDFTESCNSSDSTTGINMTEEWELDYIKDVLSSIELMYKDYASGRTRDTINPHLFVQLERKRGSSSSYKEVSLAEKKALFDCVSECLGWRCQRFVGGGFRAWEKGLTVVRRKERLVEEVYGEIQGWRRMRSCMVDELVGKDMSIPHGRWLDFEGDGFGIAVEVESMMFDDLVVEVVADVLAGSRIKD